jgi:hypothetical protein
LALGLQNTGSSNLDINVEVKIEPTNIDYVKQEIKAEVVDNKVEMGEEGYISNEEAQPQNTPKLSPSLFTITKSRECMVTASIVYEDADMR